MRKAIFWILFALLVGGAYVGAIKCNERNAENRLRERNESPLYLDPSYAPIHTKPDGGEHEPKNLAETTVIAVFADWSQHHFSRMHTMFANAGKRDRFVARMQYTPVTYYGIDFIASRETENGWDVEFQVEVTSLASVLAAAYINVKIPYQSGQAPFRFTPRTLQIEEFRWVKQVWHLIKGGEAFLIDLDIDENGAYGSPNIMHYVLEAAAMPVIDSDGRSLTGGADHILRLVPWQMGLEISFGQSPEENERQIERSAVLHDQAAAKLKVMVEKFKAKKAKGCSF